MNINNTLLYGKTYEDIQIILESEREFMQPEDFHNNLSAEDKLKLRKTLLMKIARKEFMDSVKCALEELEENAEIFIKMTAPPEKVIDKDVKTLKGWMDSEFYALSNYLKKGDKVDSYIIGHLLNVVPPKSYSGTFFQYGEPMDISDKGNLYMTFTYGYNDNNYGGEVWMYNGLCLAGTFKN